LETAVERHTTQDGRHAGIVWLAAASTVRLSREERVLAVAIED
jgi:hypothetical protein